MSVETELAKINANVKTYGDLLSEVREDTKKLLSFQSQTEERLRTGSNEFSSHREALKNHADLITSNANCLKEHTVEIKELEKKIPSKKWIYSLISIGFIILGLLIKV